MTLSPCSRDEAQRFLAEIEQWCAANGTPESYVGHSAFRHPGFVGLLRKRLKLTHQRREIVRELMERHPDGIDRDGLPSMFLKVIAPSKQVRGKAPVAQVGAWQCPACGHYPVQACGYATCRFGERPA